MGVMNAVEQASAAAIAKAYGLELIWIAALKAIGATMTAAA